MGQSSVFVSTKDSFSIITVTIPDMIKIAIVTMILTTIDAIATKAEIKIIERTTITIMIN
jgi:hypothetical protein